ncbi:MAG TPA: protein kinase [Vicinamibacterales bacterium]|nr:protein kinase [Vicinamibacterales bacterium]
MTPDEWRRIKTIVAGALNQPASTRDAYVGTCCEEDTALRTEVQSLLHAVARAEDLYEDSGLCIAGAVDALEELRSADRMGQLLGPYRIVRELGDGGMGTAYLAERADGAYEKQVAIKVVKRGMDTEAILRRFRQERQTLAELDHPNIARLLDGGSTADGLPYFVMEYVDGEPLDAYCAGRGLSVADRLRLFQHVCEAVAYAHVRRIVHRDLKPRNILVTRDGVPKLLDFGIAKALGPDTEGQSRDEPTLLARAMTPQYASPEQVRGELVTVASDIYSLGVILYELLARRPPYDVRGRTPSQIEDLICHAIPDPPGAAAALDRIVLMALHKEPSQRYSSVAALAADLERYLQGQPVQARLGALWGLRRVVARRRTAIASVATAIAIAGATAGWWSSTRPPAPVDLTIRSLAVLRFAREVESETVAVLADGLTDSLIESLSRVPALRVASLGAARPYSAGTIDPGKIGKALNVQAVLAGRVALAGGGFTLDLQLLDTADHHRLWGGQYRSPAAELPALRGLITRSLADVLAPGLSGAERQRLDDRHTANSDAYELYLKGRYLSNRRTEESLAQAVEYFRQAIAKDPQYALAYAGLADCYNLLTIWGATAPSDGMPKVKEAAFKAITIDPALAEGHTTLAFARWVYDWDWNGAAAEFERALELDPDYATARDWHAYFLASRRRFDDAIAEIRRAQALEPLSASIGTDAGEIYYWAGRYDQAVEQLRSVLQVEPGFAMAHHILGLTYLKTGRASEAVAELENAEHLATGPRMLSALGYAYGVSGQRARAKGVLDRVRGLGTARYTSAFAMALLHAGLGNRASALDELELAFAERSDTMAILGAYPPLDGLRGEPRFQSLLARVGTPLD